MCRQFRRITVGMICCILFPMLASCAGDTTRPEGTTGGGEASTSVGKLTEPENTVPPSGITTEAGSLPAGTEPTEPLPPKTFRLLATGHSNIHCSVRYLTSIAKDLGTDMTVGLVWRGDATFKTYTDMGRLRDRFVYRKSNDSDFTDATAVSPSTFLENLADDEWDVISVNQGFLYSSYPDSKADLPGLIGMIRDVCPDTPIYHNLGLAYMDGCDNALFRQEYNGNTDAMFETILRDVSENIMPNPGISGLIPTGTLIKSLTTSEYRDRIYVADKVHLGDYGCYAAGVLWYAALAGASVEALEWTPDGVSAEYRDFVIGLVPRILADPYTVIDFGMREEESGQNDDLKGIKLTAEVTIDYTDGGYMDKFADFFLSENGQNGIDVSSVNGAEGRCIWAVTNDIVAQYPILNYSLWGEGISKICITRLWSDGVGDIELPVTTGAHSIDIAALLAEQEVETLGYSYISVYTSSAEPVRITNFSLSGTAAE